MHLQMEYAYAHLTDDAYFLCNYAR